MASVNMAIVVGYVGGEPVTDTTQSGRIVVNFSIVTTEGGYTNQQGQQVPAKTMWHDIVCWGKLAEVARNYVRKGSQVYVQGKMRTRQYHDRLGVQRLAFEIECETLQLLDRKGDNAGAAPITAATQQQQNQQPPQQYDETPF